VIWQQRKAVVEESQELARSEMQSQEVEVVAEEGEEGDRICQLRH